MPWSSNHIKWLKDTGTRLTTAEGKNVEVWELQHQNDPAVISRWAKHFRNHYCLDAELDYMIDGTGMSKAEYLTSIKFPDISIKPGPGVRAGDFGEILVADYLEYIMGYWVPRTRYANKDVRNESSKGCDIIGFKCLADGVARPTDILAIFEAKAQFSGKTAKHKLQEAVDGSAKDKTRKGESLNAIKQRLFDKGELAKAKIVQRFQKPDDRSYKEVFGAAALFSISSYNPSLISTTTVQHHPNPGSLVLIVIRGDDMMRLVHDLYRRAADEA